MDKIKQININNEGDKDITIDNIIVCPIDDHATLGVQYLVDNILLENKNRLTILENNVIQNNQYLL